MAVILLIGEERERVVGIRALLRQDRHAVTWMRDIDQWRETESEMRPELVVAAVGSTDPLLNVVGKPPRGFPAPLLFVQHDADFFRDVHIDERLVDRIESPFNAEEMLARVDALVRLRQVVLRGGRRPVKEPRGAPVRGGFRGLGSRLAALLGTRVPRLPKPTAPYLEVVAGLAAWADRRDMFEPGHAERVTSFAAMMADGLGLPDGEASSLLRAAMVHDIGKVALPVQVLRMKGPLEDDQMRLIRTHPERGAALLRALDPDEVVAETIFDHHERMDGSGYHGKTEDRVSRASRILAVAETYDAMTTSKVGQTLSADRAQEALREKSGSQFDADCVDALLDALRPRPTYIPLSGFHVPRGPHD